MGTISDEEIRRIREANDIVSVFGDRVPVRQRGRDYWCCCPIHDEKTPSCKLDQAEQLWHCFGCGAGGDVFSFIMQLDDLTFPEAVRKLADRVGIQIQESNESNAVSRGHKSRLKEVCKESALFYHHQLMRSKDADAAGARAYLGERHFGGEVPKKWQLGFAPGKGELSRYLTNKGYTPKELVAANVSMGDKGGLKDRFYQRIMFPICDIQGDVIAFGGRVVRDGQPKYLNSQETPIFHKSEVLYGLHLAKSAMTATGTAVVVEGYTDVIALHEAGIKNVVATLGTALTGQHIRVLSRYAKHRIIYLFDGDEAGQRAADRALSFIDESITPEAGSRKIEIMAVTLPESRDPAEFVEEYGADAMQAQLDDAKPLISYGIERRLAAYDLTKAEDRGRALNDALQILAPIKESLLAKDYAIQIASKVHAREEDAINLLTRLKPVRLPQTEQDTEKGDERQDPTQSDSDIFSEIERNRRRFEQEFLSLCASNPEIALKYADILANTRWHLSLHSSLAESILSSLEKNEQAKPAEIVSEAQTVVPGAERILTLGLSTRRKDPEAFALFLTEELDIGDTEESIAALRSQLNDVKSIEKEEMELLFSTVVSMQKELIEKKKRHVPYVE